MKTPKNAFGYQNVREGPHPCKGFDYAFSSEARAVNARHELTEEQRVWVRAQLSK